jgi:hypothetical protein
MLPAGLRPGQVEAGDWLWVADGSTLVRVSLSSGAVTATVAEPEVTTSSLSTDRPGTTMIVAETLAGFGVRVQRRNPATGHPVVQMPKQLWSSVALSAVIDGGVWVSYAGGMQGGVERLDATTLRATRTKLGISEGSSAIDAVVAAGRSFVTDVGLGRRFNFCADAATGSREVALPTEIREGARILTASGNDLYVAIAVRGGSGLTQTLQLLPVSPGCKL